MAINIQYYLTNSPVTGEDTYVVMVRDTQSGERWAANFDSDLLQDCYQKTPSTDQTLAAFADHAHFHAANNFQTFNRLIEAGWPAPAALLMIQEKLHIKFKPVEGPTKEDVAQRVPRLREKCEDYLARVLTGEKLLDLSFEGSLLEPLVELVERDSQIAFPQIQVHCFNASSGMKH